MITGLRIRVAIDANDRRDERRRPERGQFAVDDVGFFARGFQRTAGINRGFVLFARNGAFLWVTSTSSWSRSRAERVPADVHRLPRDRRTCSSPSQGPSDRAKNRAAFQASRRSAPPARLPTLLPPELPVRPTGSRPQKSCAAWAVTPRGSVSVTVTSPVSVFEPRVRHAHLIASTRTFFVEFAPRFHLDLAASFFSFAETRRELQSLEP